MTDHEELYTDQELFPGWNFEVTQEEKIISNPVKLLQESLQKLSTKEKKTFDKAVIAKHTKYGAISMFKGVDEIHFAKLRSAAKNEILRIRASIDDCESEIADLEKKLADSRINISRSNRELETLKKEIIFIFPQVIKPFKDLHHILSRNLEYSDLPSDPRLLFNKKYKGLHMEIERLSLLVEECSRNIPDIEEKLVPARHHLAMLRVEESELKPLDEKLDEIDLQEKIEKEIVERFRFVRKEKRIIAANERMKKFKESLEVKKIQEQKLHEEKEKELKEKRKHLMNLLKAEIHKIEEERKALREAEIAGKNKILLAVKKLNEKVSKIKKKIVPKSENDRTTGSESDIELIKKKIRAKELKYEFERQKKKERQEAIEERKMLILEKLLQENERFKIREIIPQKSSRKLPKAVKTRDPVMAAIPEDISLNSIEESKLLAKPRVHRAKLPPPKHKFIPAKEDDVVLEGPPFLISKTSIEFLDYDPSKKYSQKIEIVNVSRRVNTFKLVYFPLEYSTILSIKIDAPGYVNPGMKTKGVILFHPPSRSFSEDIEAEIILKAEWGGNFTIPISCKKKRTIPAFESLHGPGYQKLMFTTIDEKNTSTPSALKSPEHLVVDYGECTEGDRRCQTITVINRGALSCEYTINAPRMEFEGYAYELECERESTLLGYGRLKIKVYFMPGIVEIDSQQETEKMPMTYDFSIEFSNNQKFLVSCIGFRAKSFIQVEPKTVDFSLCSVGQIYRQKIVLINQINIATKIWITAEGAGSTSQLDRLSIQSDRIGDIEIHPSLAFVQSNDPFPIWLTIMPNIKAAELSNDGESEFELLIRVNYLQKNGKKNYTSVCITGRITGNRILFKSIYNDHQDTTMDFGHVSVLECKQLALEVENTSRLPQEIELLSDNPRIKIVSNDEAIDKEGLSLDPKEKILKLIRFEPDCYGPFCCKIIARNKLNQKFKIIVKGFGLVPPLQFLNDRYSFPDVSFGTLKTTTFILQRSKLFSDESADFMFEFGDPFPDSSSHSNSVGNPFFRMSPHRGIFSGKQRIPIEVALIPSINQEKSAENQYYSSLIRNTENENETKPGLSEPLFISYVFPCYIKPHLSESDRLQALLDAGMGDRAVSGKMEPYQGSKSSVIFFKVSANIFPPEIALCDPSLGMINFGQVPVGEKVVKSFVIKNLSKNDIRLKSNGLNPSGGFFLVKALRDVSPYQTLEVKLAFIPDSPRIYREYLELITPKTTLKIKLDAEGIFPEVNIETPDLIVSFDDTIVGETSCRKIKVWNNKHYTISFIVELASLEDKSKHIFSNSNWHFNAPFDVARKRVKLEPNTFVELDVSFRPTIEADNYHDILKLYIKGNKEPSEILLQGRGWESSSFLSGYDFDLNESQIVPPEKCYPEVLKNSAGIDGFSIPDANGKGSIIDEENLAILAQSPYKKDIYFSTLTCYWKKSDSGTWELDLKEIIIMNVKLAGLKLDLGKRPTDCQFIIEPVELTFNYNKDLDHFTIEKSNSLPTDTKFTFESLQGTVPLDSSTRIKLKTFNSMESYWRDFQQKWTQYGTIADNEADNTSGNTSALIHPIFRPQLDSIQKKLAAFAVSEPFPIESCFKITLKGGYRYSDPRGPMSPFDARVWMLKVVSKVEK